MSLRHVCICSRQSTRTIASLFRKARSDLGGLALIWCLASGIFWSIGVGVASAQVGDGPRAYQLLPEGTKVLSQFILGTRGNVTPSDGTILRDADLDLNLGITEYSQTFDLNGHQAGWLVLVPYGEVSGGLGFGAAGQSASTSGLGDIKLGFIYGMLGAPNLSFEDYTQYDPELAVTFLGRLTMPTGRYNSDSSLNMGGNRWALELGLPVTYYVGNSFLDPSLTTFEIQPKVTVFSDNTDAPGATKKLSQEPIFSVEAHVTRNFGQAFWGSIDALYTYGGATKSDGFDNENTQRSFAMGITGNLNLSASTSLKLTYGEVVSGNPDGSDGRVLRAQLLYLF